jgi:hypothetical protein
MCYVNERKKTRAELLASLVGDGREEQCASSEAQVKPPQRADQVETWRRSRSERDRETDAWLMHGCT